MNKKEILKYNSEEFINDLNSVNEFLTYVKATNSFFKIRKRELLETAHIRKIHYYITDGIYVVKRNVMVIV